jgi:hypothetical protein
MQSATNEIIEKQVAAFLEEPPCVYEAGNLGDIEGLFPHQSAWS